MTIYILIRTNDCEREELDREYFLKREDALARARREMEDTLPKRRKTRQADIDEAIAELDADGFTGRSNIYYEYRIIEAKVN